MTVQIASIHFAPVEQDRSIYGGMYKIPAVALSGEPHLLTIEDKVQRDEGPVSSGPGGGKRQPLKYFVDCYEIAEDLIKHWTANGLGMTPDCHPGLWIVRDRLPLHHPDGSPIIDGFNKPQYRPATVEEKQGMWTEDLAHAIKADREYAHWCYREGNRIAADARSIQFIAVNYKRAARHYGLQAEWLKEGAALEVFPCPSCSTIITKSALVCPKCNEPPDIQRWAVWQASKDNAVKEARLAIKVA